MTGKFPLFPFSSYAFAFPDNFSIKTLVLGTVAHTCDPSWESEASLVSLVSFTRMTLPVSKITVLHWYLYLF